ncbi:MAG TPA: glycosyltransferase family 9 protein [Candidatus Kapabacteria bacterium]|nr:glycosyltransferase family 9 protein [Candidatus Kapabacteria bacterium]
MRRFFNPLIRLVWGTWLHKVPINPDAVTKIAICPAGGIGDSITILPIISLLKRLCPSANIDIITIERNAIIFNNNSDIHAIHIIYTDEDWKKMRVNSYSLIFVLNWIHISEWAIRAWKIGGYHSIRVTPFQGEKYAALFSYQAKPISPPQNVTDIYIALVEEVFGQTIAESEKLLLPYSIALPQDALEYGSHIVSQMSTERYCVINYSVIHEKKQWHNDGYGAVAELLLRIMPHHTIIVLTMENDYESAKKCLYGLDEQRCFIPSPSQNVLHAIAMMRKADFLFTVDTSFIHCCSAFGIPVFGLYIGEKHNAQLWSARNVPFAAVETHNGKPIRTLNTEDVIVALEHFIRQYVLTKEIPYA